VRTKFDIYVFIPKYYENGETEFPWVKKMQIVAIFIAESRLSGEPHKP